MTSLFSLDLFTIFRFFIQSLTRFMLFLLLLRPFFQHSAFVSSQNSVTFQGKIGNRQNFFLPPLTIRELFS